jgi:uncharacterized protein (TIGR02001 family)
MRSKFSAAAAISLLCLWGSLSHAAPPDTSSMPQLILTPATPPEEVPNEPQFLFSATAATDYIFRGVSQTENRPAVFGAARVTDDQFYAGVGIENVDFRNSTDAEYDLSAGWTPIIAGFRLDLGVIRYGYIDEPAHSHIDTVDYKGVVLHDLGPLTLGAAIFYTPNFFGSGHAGEYAEGRAAYRITDKFSAGGAFGRQFVDDGIDHTTWNAGLNYAVIKEISLDLRYYDTNEHGLGSLYGSHYVASIKASF